MPRRFGPKKRIVTKYFLEVTTDARGRRTFIDNKPRPRFKYTAERKLRRAEELDCISRLMEKHGIPIQRVLKRDANLTAQNFVAGKLLTDVPLTRELLTQIATTLAKIHSIRETERLSQPNMERLGTPQRIGFNIAFLVKEGVLSTMEGKRMRNLLAHSPKQADIVLSHNDVAKQNMVIRGGKVYFIDIGDAGLVFRDLELARTFFNLNLTPAQRRLFLQVYRRNGGKTETFEKTARYWTTYVLLYRLSKWCKRKYSAEKINALKTQLLETAS